MTYYRGYRMGTAYPPASTIFVLAEESDGLTQVCVPVLIDDKHAAVRNASFSLSGVAVPAAAVIENPTEAAFAAAIPVSQPALARDETVHWSLQRIAHSH